MGNKILAVHLTQHRLCIATAESSLRSLRVDTVLDMERDRAMNLARLLPNRDWDRVVATVPPCGATFRLLDFAFRDRRRLDQAVGPALEEHVPISLDESIAAWDFASADRRGRVLALLAPRTGLDAHLDALAKFGVKPTRVFWSPCATVELYRRALGTDSAYSFVDISHDGAVVASVAHGALTALRTVSPCKSAMMVRNIAWSLRTIAPPTARLVLGGPGVRKVAPALAEALPELRLEPLPDACPLELAPNTSTHWTSAAPALGLLYAATGDTGHPWVELPAGTAASQGEAGVDGAWDLWRPALPWAALAAGLTVAAVAADYRRLSAEYRALETRAEQIYTAAVPGGKGSSGRRLKLEMRLNELTRQAEQSAGVPSTATPLSVLSTMSSTISPDLDVEFNSFLHDPPNLRVTGRGSSFETVTRVQEILQANGDFASVEVRDVRSAVAGDGVDFQLNIKLAERKGAA